MNHAELIMRRKNVRAFIKADGIKVSFVRKGNSTKNTNTGGYIPGLDRTLDPQEVRIVQNVRRYTDGLVNSEAGDIPDTEYRLVAIHTTDIEVNDTFAYQGEVYQVTGIHGARVESVFAAIELHGKPNRG